MARRSLGFAWVACILALASCVSPEELRRDGEATCVGYGFHPGTDAFATCLQRGASPGVTQLRHRYRIGDMEVTGAAGGDRIGPSWLRRSPVIAGGGVWLSVWPFVC